MKLEWIGVELIRYALESVDEMIREFSIQVVRESIMYKEEMIKEH